ncbi:copper chaperone PCu(A)C [Aquabacterium sp. A7-Y]|uniref:copper chaperone PCu(A)C n=1 Tax=Aquabacterium sp. A7-Y TaxID=1349605 RepID=UPI00223CD4A8|nr:copper chaperone PCu(A)C [Aquabacterium sp. A7-Y]MCW7537800.1 copper chaperone PCu(A)C [Aquabacterium sp. A7-Y]
MKRALCLLALAGALGSAASPPPAAGVLVHNAWARPTVPGQNSGGGFLTLENPGQAADRLVSARTPAAASTELHSMKMEGLVMRMRQVEGIELPPGQKVELKPGGLHVMFFGLKAALKQGDVLPVTLQFEKAGEITVQMKVGSGAVPAAVQPHHGQHAPR